MDKKQALTPELKQIYERVMNTPVASGNKPQPSVARAPTPVTVETPKINPETPSDLPPTPTSSTGGFAFTSPAPVLPHAAAPGASNSTAQTVVLMSKKGGAGMKLAVFGGITFLVFYVVFWLKFFKYM